MPYDSVGATWRSAMRESTYDPQEEAWNVWQITRYNYTYPVNWGGFDPDDPDDVSTNFSGIEGEPDRFGGVAEVGTNWNGHGMDRLIGYKVYRPDQQDFIYFAAYDYEDWHGNLSRKTEMGTGVPEEADLLAQPFRKTLRLRHLPGMMPGRRLLQDVHAQWWQPDAQSCEAGDPCPEWAFFESYAYDWQGRRIAKMHCADAGKFVAFSNFYDPGSSCKDGPIAISYDYDGSQVLVERRIPLGEEGEFAQPPGSKDRILSIYTWGATGLVQRVAGQEDLCPDNDCTYQYLNDATGNCVGVVCAGGGSVGGSCSSANLYAVRFTRMDAWGNLISPVYLDGLPPPLPVADIDCTASTAEGCEPADGMPQDEVLAGPYQYHGSDRYETDLIDMDKLLRPDGGQAAPGAGRSTGFVHVGVRYYEPATGRFLQHDPLFIDPTPFAWGQHNRWVYCANDPVNIRDDSGLAATLADFLIGAGLVLLAAGLEVLGDYVTDPALKFAINTATIILGGIGLTLMFNNYAAGLRAAKTLWSLLGPYVVRVLLYLLSGILMGLAILMNVGRNPCFLNAIRNMRSFSDFMRILNDLSKGLYGRSDGPCLSESVQWAVCRASEATDVRVGVHPMHRWQQQPEASSTMSNGVVGDYC